MAYEFVSTTNLLIIHDDQLLLLKRSQQAKDFPGWLMPPGGKQEIDETPLETAVRETVEETGITASNPRLKIVATHNHEYKQKVYLVYIFVATEFTGDLIESTEGEPMWMNLDEFLSHPKSFPDLKRHIELATASPADEIIFTYHRFNGELEIIESM
jgi:8-oxo-dGTP diphosphatase